MMELEQYLSKAHSPSTVRIYAYEIRKYLRYREHLYAEQAGQGEVLRYIAHLRQQYDNPGTIRRIVYALKQYYHYLIAAGKRTSHPCRYLRIRDAGPADIQVQDLLSPRELELLLERKERYGRLAIRNKVIMSLLVYQALALKELAGLRVEDVNLEKGNIYIRATAKANARRLPLQGQQSLWLYRYLKEARPKLLKEATPALILTSRGAPERGEGIQYLVETFRGRFPTKRLTPTTIRQSVLANLLKSGQGLRQVQAFAGHRKPSSTEKYRQDNLEALKAAIDKYHPGVAAGATEYFNKK